LTAARLTSATFVSALLRLAQQEGGFAAVVKRGDETAGAVLILLAERGQIVDVLERVLGGEGRYVWASPLGAGHNAADIDRFLEKRRRFDPDSWLIELDTASAERFADEIRAID
jgi:hypothetical protein